MHQSGMCPADDERTDWNWIEIARPECEKRVSKCNYISVQPKIIFDTKFHASFSPWSWVELNQMIKVLRCSGDCLKSSTIDWNHTLWTWRGTWMSMWQRESALASIWEALQKKWYSESEWGIIRQRVLLQQQRFRDLGMVTKLFINQIIAIFNSSILAARRRNASVLLSCSLVVVVQLLKLTSYLFRVWLFSESLFHELLKF
jgi:hypothetical protein